MKCFCIFRRQTLCFRINSSRCRSDQAGVFLAKTNNMKEGFQWLHRYLNSHTHNYSNLGVLLMKCRKYLCKSLSFLFVAVLICAFSMINLPSMEAKSLSFVQGFMFNQYYRIKNVESGLYLTMNSQYDYENTGCSLQTRSDNNNSQIFYIKLCYSDDAYALIPKSSTNNRVLTGDSTNSVKLKTDVSSSYQKWIINLTVNGYSIKNLESFSFLVPINATSNSEVCTGSFSLEYSEWILEPAYEGKCSYFVATNDLNSSNSPIVDQIVDLFDDYGYDEERVDLPVSGRLMVRTPVNRVTVFHGHGFASALKFSQSNGNDYWLYSENPPSGSIAYTCGSYRNSFIAFLSCESAAQSDTRCSLVDAAYNMGAGCVMGFVYSVAGAESYLNTVLFYESVFHSTSLSDCMILADMDYCATQRAEETCPANTNNRYISGNSNLSIFLA